MTAEFAVQSAPRVATVADRLARIEAELDAIDLAAYEGHDSRQARLHATALRRIESRVATHVGAAVRAATSDTSDKTALQSLARDFGHDPIAARRQAKQAEQLAEARLTEHAAAVGTISHRHATVIGRALDDLPAGTTREQKLFAEKALIRDAGRLSPTDLATRGRRITDQFKADDDVDADEDRLLRRREAMARANTRLSLWDCKDGTWEGRFRIPELHGRILKTLIDAYTAPRRAHVDEAAADPFDPLDKKQGQALCQLLEHVPTDKLPTSGGTPVRIVVTIDESKLRSDVAAATLATGERISAGELRRLAVNHDILPAVLGGDSIPLDWGRAKRVFSKDQRDALAVLDGGCTAPGCDRPPSWCEAQHTDRWWADTGNTDLNRGTLHCPAHHHQADAEGWKYKRVKGVMHIDRGKGHGWEINHRFRP